MDSKVIEKQINSVEKNITKLSLKMSNIKNISLENSLEKEIIKNKEILYHLERIQLILKYN